MRRDMVVIFDEIREGVAHNDYSHVEKAGMVTILTEARERRRGLRKCASYMLQVLCCLLQLVKQLRAEVFECRNKRFNRLQVGIVNLVK